ncbi:MAG: hypothetical protein IPF92_15265 [Myxococcales bacterium]|jgi:hypothetical protein|nr:hypothetical protein [Myxococcales bacterium]MBL0195233.1 hypothetical protein [Myxococcales bacterium]HQY64668.1 hypothetical protein [Polyangiaceae bacterium]
MVLRATGIGVFFVSIGLLFSACSDDPVASDAGAAPTTTTTTTVPTTTSTTTTPPTPTGTGTVPPPVDAGGDTAVPPPDASDGGGPAAPTFTMVYSTIISQKCGNNCHLKANNPSGGLAMDTKAKAHTSLVGVDVTNACTGATKRVVAGDAAKSKIYVKVSAAAAAIPGCGNRMPNPGTTPLAAAEIKAIGDWINAGAKND